MTPPGSSVKAKGDEAVMSSFETESKCGQTLEERMSHAHQCFKENWNPIFLEFCPPSDCNSGLCISFSCQLL